MAENWRVWGAVGLDGPVMEGVSYDVMRRMVDEHESDGWLGEEPETGQSYPPGLF